MIELKPFTEADFDLLISWIENEEALMQFAGVNFTFPLSQEQLVVNLANKKIQAFKAVQLLSNKTIGHGEIYTTDEGEAILGKIIIGFPHLRGKGFGQQIVQQLLHIAFKERNIQRAMLYVFDWNTNAIKCYQNAGFEIEKGGTKKRYINGKSWTAVKMVIDKDAWMKRKDTN